MLKVRDVLVPFRTYDINVHYMLMNISQGDYESYLRNVDNALVIETLVIERG